MTNSSLATKFDYIPIVFFVLLLFSFKANAFTCQTSTGQSLGDAMSGGMIQSASIGVNLSPVITTGGTLVVDLSSVISCVNQATPPAKDVIRAENGSTYIDVLNGFTGTLVYYGSSYPFPLSSPTSYVNVGDYGVYSPWKATLYLSPIGVAGGVVIKSGQYFASIKLYKIVLDATGAPEDGTGKPDEFTWNLMANNDVVIPTGSCDVSARDVTVTLPDYPGTASVPVSVHCAQEQNLSYYLSGTTVDSANSIFQNSASNSPAQGIGIQMLRNSSVISSNSLVSLGIVGTSPIDLGLTTTYARTNDQVTAGNVQSIIGVTFVYQ